MSLCCSTLAHDVQEQQLLIVPYYRCTACALCLPGQLLLVSMCYRLLDTARRDALTLLSFLLQDRLFPAVPSDQASLYSRPASKGMRGMGASYDFGSRDHIFEQGLL
jgi:hypothetical protein